MQAHTAPAPWINYAVWALLIGVVLILRVRRMRKARNLRLETLWIVPAIFAVAIAATFIAMPPSVAALGWSALALVIGAGVGWYRGKMMKITIDPATHKFSQQASPLAIIVLVGLFAARAAFRAEFDTGSGNMSPAAVIAADAALAFALGLISATRLEMALRAKRLLRESLSRTFS